MVPAVGRSAEKERGSASGVAGAAVLGCCAGWALITAAGRDARPEGMLLALLAVAAGFAFGRIVGALLPVAAPAGAALAGFLIAVAGPYGLPGTVVVPAPGREGADAALFALAAGAACCAAWAAHRFAARLALLLAAAGIAVAALLLDSPAGGAAALAVLLASLAAARARHRLPGLAGCALTAALVAGGSWALAGGVLPQGAAVSLEHRLTEHRVLLWQDASDMAGRQPLLGVGPDRFGAVSETVLRTAGSDGKPHSAPLQQAAEQGLPGVALLAASFGWLLFVLWRSPRSAPVVLTAGAALTVLAALASVGNALSFAPVTAGAGLLAGLATARPLSYATDPSPASRTATGAHPAGTGCHDGTPAG